MSLRLGLAFLCGAWTWVHGAYDDRGATSCDTFAPSNVSLHSFASKDVLKQREIVLSQFRGHVVLVVNVATYSAYASTYPQLNQLQVQYGRRGFDVLAFPCNQFGLLEPGKEAEILNGIRYVRPGGNFVPVFTMFERTDVNGAHQHPLYEYLKSRCPSPESVFADKETLFYSPQHSNDIRWNFEKFLVDTKGLPRKRYSAAVQLEDLRPDIEGLLAEYGL